ncbi:hypothetical protein P9112_007592 [Eukaryota sp. TZLM1-RC]
MSKPPRFDNISYVSVGSKIAGHVILNPDVVIWRAKSSDTKHRVLTQGLQLAQFIPLRHGNRLKLIGMDDTTLVLDGFDSSDRSTIEKFLQEHAAVHLESPKWSVKGTTWGNVSVEKDSVAFDVDDGRSFELSFNSISNANNPHKNEVELDFHQDDQCAEAGDDFLCQVKFHIPDEWMGEGAQEIVGRVRENTKVVVSSKDVLAEFSDITFVTPRGKYDIALFPSYIRLHGKTHSYKVLCESVSRLFLLPKPDGRSIFFVISLDRPIRQGATSYNHLVANLIPEKEIELELNITEEECQRLYDGKIQPFMSGSLSKVIARVFRCVTGTKVTIPNEQGFKSFDESSAVKVAHKQHEGFLFPLEKSFIYLHKPPLVYRYDALKAIEFSRVSGRGDSRTFDMEILPRTGEKIMFSQILKEEYEPLSKFFKEKGLRVRNVVEEGSAQRVLDILSEPEEESEEDEEFAGVESPSDSELSAVEEGGEELAEIAPLEKVDESNIVEGGRKRRSRIV